MHDIKNALAVLEGELHALADELQHERAQRAWQDCRILREKLIGFLTLYKESTGSLKARIEDASPLHFLQALLADTPHRREGVEIGIDATGMPPLAFFDEYLTGLALEAALQNAVRFAATRITLACGAADGGGVVFRVIDDGPGLRSVQPDDEAAELVSSGERSTGLGTALCRAVAAAHTRGGRSGFCETKNGAEGGAVFELFLP